MNDIRERHKIEKKFHDEKAKGEHEISSFFKLGVSNYVLKKLIVKLNDLDNKEVLEFGCGSAWLSKILARKGGNVHAFDISIESLRQSAVLRKKDDIDIHFYNMSAEQLAFKSNSFDIVTGNAILHHTELEKAVEEIYRVLKDGGKAYFIEPLGHNPLINLYRKKTPNLRSATEKPLLFDDINKFKKKFRSVNHNGYFFLALLAFIFYFGIKNDKLFVKSLNILHKIDEIFLKIFPVFRKYCWYTLISLEK